MKETLPVQWASNVIGSKNYQILEAQFDRNPFVRYSIISAALISQIVGLLLVCFLGIMIGSFAISLLR
jgi:hypothetical protein